MQNYFSDEFIISIPILSLIDGLKHNQKRDRAGNIMLIEQTRYLSNSVIGKLAVLNFVNETKRCSNFNLLPCDLLPY